MGINTPTDFAPAVDEFASENITDIDARPQASTSPAIDIASGWEAADKSVASKDYAKDFKVTEQLQIIKFLGTDGAPYAIYSQHFLSQITEGQRSFTCIGAGCPLCIKLESKAERKYAFSIAVLTPTGTVRTRMIVSPKLYQAISAAHHAQGPLTSKYWAVARKGQMQNVAYILNPVKGRDLGEDWGIDEAAAEAAIAEMVPFDSSSVKVLSLAELEALAADLA